MGDKTNKCTNPKSDTIALQGRRCGPPAHDIACRFFLRAKKVHHPALVTMLPLHAVYKSARPDSRSAGVSRAPPANDQLQPDGCKPQERKAHINPPNPTMFVGVFRGRKAALAMPGTTRLELYRLDQQARSRAIGATGDRRRKQGQPCTSGLERGHAVQT